MTQSEDDKDKNSIIPLLSRWNQWRVGGVIWVAIFAFLLGMCVNIGKREEKSYSKSTQLTAFDRMNLTFRHNPSQSDIERLMNQTMRWYNHPTTEENYMKFGSILLRICQDSRFSEMDVMHCMIRMRDAAGPTASPEMYEAAAICSAL